ncbi:MAG: histidinol-phosphate transaminase [Gammaproteobacteria bacterium]|nr:histidinol-phosphate transaminase [Gammaproteobacteria bacterium]
MKETFTEIVARLVRPEIQALAPYHVPDATGMVKLDAMENPYRWPPEIISAWLEQLRSAPLNRYPDPEARTLRARLRESMAVPAQCGMVLGNGSDELIQMIALAVAMPDRTILAPEPSFVMYPMIAAFTGMHYVGVPLQKDFSLDLDAMRAAIVKHQPAAVFLAYPNNPTGNLYDGQAMCTIIEECPGLVIVDEAYHAFAGKSFMDALQRYPNLLVMRTLSKMGLAGLRLGALIGAPAWLTEINKIRLPYNINVLTQISAEFALTHHDILTAQAEQIIAERERLSVELRKLPGLTVYPSSANFILFRTPAGRATEIFDGLKHHLVLIKNLDHTGGVLKDCLRVTVGTAEENRLLLIALKAVL